MHSLLKSATLCVPGARYCASSSKMRCDCNWISRSVMPVSVRGLFVDIGGDRLCSSDAHRSKRRPVVEIDEHGGIGRSEEHTSELQSLTNLVCRLLLEKKKKKKKLETKHTNERKMCRASRGR